jgi:hypothetical protein
MKYFIFYFKAEAEISDEEEKPKITLRKIDDLIGSDEISDMEDLSDLNRPDNVLSKTSKNSTAEKKDKQESSKVTTLLQN